MPTHDLCWMTAAELAAAIKTKKVRAAAAFEAARPWAQHRPDGAQP